MIRFLFVGEQRSPRAKELGVHLEDGRLAGRSLFDALMACGIDPLRHRYCNIFEGHGRLVVHRHQRAGWLIIGMGAKVQRELRRCGIPHYALVHPAARGAIRKKHRYAAHVRGVLGRIRLSA